MSTPARRRHCTNSQNPMSEMPLSFESRAVHGGSHPRDSSGALVPSISLASTFAQTYPGRKTGIEDPNSFGTGFFYSRQANPTRGAFERALSNLENGKHCISFASGLAATSAVMALLSGKDHDHVLALNDLYGGTTAQFKEFSVSNGIDFTFLDFDDVSALEAAITPHTRMVWLETPTNPNLKVTDIAGIAAFCKRHSLLLVVDNTFMSPFLQNPLALGADIVLHSVTKYIAGHSDVLMGAVITNDDTIYTKLRKTQNLIGAVPSPFECYLAMRGLRTLHLRVERASENALAIAKFLEAHPAVKRVLYPGLPSHPQHELSQRQSRGGGAMITFLIKGGKDTAFKFLSSLKLITLAVSLGAVESLACSPAIMTHNTVSEETRRTAGITDDLIRLSVGVEGVEDLIKDLDAALIAAAL